jgi:hypothetical protein
MSFSRWMTCRSPTANRAVAAKRWSDAVIFTVPARRRDEVTRSIRRRSGESRPRPLCGVPLPPGFGRALANSTTSDAMRYSSQIGAPRVRLAPQSGASPAQTPLTTAAAGGLRGIGAHQLASRHGLAWKAAPSAQCSEDAGEAPALPGGNAAARAEEAPANSERDPLTQAAKRRISTSAPLRRTSAVHASGPVAGAGDFFVRAPKAWDDGRGGYCC